MIDLSRWPALVLAAGLATRLRPLSDVRAKAAMPVAGTPIIVRILEWLRSHGIRRVVVNLHHQPASIAAIVGDGSQLDVEVRYSWEPAILGSAGGPRRALPLLDADRFFVVNGDTLTDCDLHALAQRHLDSKAAATMALVAGDVERYGGVLVKSDGRVCGFGRPRPDVRALHFIGAQAVNVEVFAGLPDNQPSETVRTLYPRLLAARHDAIAAFESDAEFLDVGTARDYLKTVATIAAREHRPFDIGVDCDVASDAIVEGSVLWDRVVIGTGARVAHCVVADDVVISAGSQFAESVLVRTPSGIAATPL
jgi:NDP-sugar pyrophosphorylase family protein